MGHELVTHLALNYEPHMKARLGAAGIAIDEVAEVAELQRLYGVQQQARLDHPYPS